MVNQYKLVNPYIKGSFETKIDASNSLDAAKQFYKNLSENFNNNIPAFYFSIQKGGKGKFYHFEVKEKKVNDEVNYSIKAYDIKGEKEALEQYVTNFKKFKGRFNGGAVLSNGGAGSKRGSKRGTKRGSKRGSKRSSKSYKHDSSESSEDSYDFYREAKSYVPVNTQPFYYMYYDPLVYRLDSTYIPSYYSFAQPAYFEIASYPLYLPSIPTIFSS